MMLVSSSPKLIKKINTELGKLFQVTDLGIMSFFLGCEYTSGRNERSESVPRFLHQTKYIQEVLKYHQMENSHAVSTPMQPSMIGTLSKNYKKEHPDIIDKPYRNAIDLLMYLAYKCPTLVRQLHQPSRPDIASFAGLLSRQVSCSQPHH